VLILQKSFFSSRVLFTPIKVGFGDLELGLNRSSCLETTKPSQLNIYGALPPIVIEAIDANARLDNLELGRAAFPIFFHVGDEIEL